MSIRANNVSLGAGEILNMRRGVTNDLLTAVSSPAPTTTSFGVLTTGATAQLGDIVQLATITQTNLAAEASTMPRITNVTISGSNTIYTVSPAFGSAPPTTANGVRVLWKDLGATDGGISIETKVDTEPVYVDQAADPILALLKSRETLIKAPLAENSLYNVAAGFGIAPSSTAGVLQIGPTSAVRQDRILLLVDAAYPYTTRYIVAHNCVNEGTTTIRAAKDAKSLVELQMRVYLDTTLPAAYQLVDMAEV